ncbi:tyrosine-type recombinase/integrase [Halobacterium salinarum]|uniref:tyrosine-type recombinase/integrase n=1 Tax=Halobacterium salinarum TaxID=2242 RepID=UPI00255659C1|nr:site-specific integrase [Halobacterium salinarum]MDL0128513.1 phage integrase SAM-like domain-containing protein [Halobacterium salinarum]
MELLETIDGGSELLEEIQAESGPERDVPIAEAVSEFCEYKSTEIVESTRKEYENKLGYFEEFCEKNSIDVLSDLEPRDIVQFRIWRRTESHSRESPLSEKTMSDEMYRFKSFLRYMERVDAAASGLHEGIEPPSGGDAVRDIDIKDERVQRILTYLNDFEYATVAHVIWAVYANSGCRPGGLHSLDRGDVHLDDENPYIEFRHRPPETSLKNQEEGERQVYIDEKVAQIIGDYIREVRAEVTTDSGREPLLTSDEGRLSKSTMRKHIYAWSRPCEVGAGCPHDRNPSSCEATRSRSVASRCPSSRPPYALRHGYLTQKRRDGAPLPILSGRCDVSEEVIRKHYDERTEEEKRELRQEHLTKLFEGNETGGFL